MCLRRTRSERSLEIRDPPVRQALLPVVSEQRFGKDFTGLFAERIVAELARNRRGGGFCGSGRGDHL